MRHLPEAEADAAYYLNNGGYNTRAVLDRMLPGKDGLTILREMRTSERKRYAGADADRAGCRQ